MGTIPDTMKAVVVHEPGASDALCVEQKWPTPKLQDGQVMVKVRLTRVEGGVMGKRRGEGGDWRE